MEDGAGLVDWFDSGAELPESNQLHKVLGIQKLESGVYLLSAGKATSRSTELAESSLHDRFQLIALP